MTDPYRIRSPETWDAAREAYLSGLSAEEACARFDLGLSAFRKRAREEGWRRADQPDPEPVEDDAFDDLPDIDDQALADLAFRRMSVEARRGRLTQALSWGRLRDMALRQVATSEREKIRIDRAVHNDTMTRFSEITTAAQTARQQALATISATRAEVAKVRARTVTASAPEVHEVHDVHDVHPVSRAERRRLEAIRRKTGPP